MISDESGTHHESTTENEPEQLSQHDRDLGYSQTREHTFGESTSESVIPLADPEEQKKVEVLNQRLAEEIEASLPGQLYDQKEREAYLKAGQSNPWDFQGRKQMDQAPTFEDFLNDQSLKEQSEERSTQNSDIKIEPSRRSVGRKSLPGASDTSRRQRQEIDLNLHDDESENEGPATSSRNLQLEKHSSHALYENCFTTSLDQRAAAESVQASGSLVAPVKGSLKEKALAKKAQKAGYEPGETPQFEKGGKENA